MERVKKTVKVGYRKNNKEYYIDRKITCIDGMGVMQEDGNRFYSVTLAKGKYEDKLLARAETFYDAADFARTLMQNNKNIYDLIEKDKVGEVVDACRTTQFILIVHFGTIVELPFGNFNSNLK